jgi:electron transfer flavoprotein alpha subunit
MRDQTEPARPLRIAALVKQIPAFENMEIGPDGRLQREGVPLEMSAFCRRAVAEGVRLAGQTGGSCTVITLGPPMAEAVLREALAYGADDAVLLSDPAFAGSDTLATARALRAALERRGPFDLILVGRNSVDAETGQVGPELAQLLDLPFATGVKQLELDQTSGPADVVRVGCEQDDTWIEETVSLPAVLSTAERLIEPCKIKDEAALAAVDGHRIERLAAADLGPGPWGQDGSPTRVGEVKVERVLRRRERLSGPIAEQVATVVAAMADRGLVPSAGRNEAHGSDPTRVVPTEVARTAIANRDSDSAPAIVVLVEPGRQRVLRELLGAAAELAGTLGGQVVAIGPSLVTPDPMTAESAGVLASWGADDIIVVDAADAGEEGTTLVEEDVARVVTEWSRRRSPSIVLAPSTAWGREVAARLAAALEAGLTGDAIGLELTEGGRLIAWKPAFGGAMVAAVEATSPTQIVTVRPGVLDVHAARPAGDIPITAASVRPRGRVIITAHRRDDDLDVLAGATRVVSVGRGVDPADYPRIESLAARLGAELAATRKVTDVGWLPHARQIGITGQNLAPDLALVIGASGKFNHMVGLRRAGLIVAVNPDATAPVFDFADYGIVAGWREVVAELERALAITD